MFCLSNCQNLKKKKNGASLTLTWTIFHMITFSQAFSFPIHSLHASNYLLSSTNPSHLINVLCFFQALDIKVDSWITNVRKVQAVYSGGSQPKGRQRHVSVNNAIWYND